MTTETRTHAKCSVIGSLANQLECDPAKLVPLLQKTAFAKCKTPEEFQVMCMISNQYSLNPILREIFAFPTKSGAVVPIVSIDGWLKIINRDPALDGIEFEEGDGYCTAIIHRKDRHHPTKVTEWSSECKGTTEPWIRWPRRMLRHKALIQCARVAFGIGGIFDEDEGERIAIAQAAEALPKRGRRATAAELLKETAKPALEAPKEPVAEAIPVSETTAAEAELAPSGNPGSGDFLE